MFDGSNTIHADYGPYTVDPETGRAPVDPTYTQRWLDEMGFSLQEGARALGITLAEMCAYAISRDRIPEAVAKDMGLIAAFGHREFKWAEGMKQAVERNRAVYAKLRRQAFRDDHRRFIDDALTYNPGDKVLTRFEFEAAVKGWFSQPKNAHLCDGLGATSETTADIWSLICEENREEFPPNAQLPSHLDGVWLTPTGKAMAARYQHPNCIAHPMLEAPAETPARIAYFLERYVASDADAQAILSVDEVTTAYMADVRKWRLPEPDREVVRKNVERWMGAACLREGVRGFGRARMYPGMRLRTDGRVMPDTKRVPMHSNPLQGLVLVPGL